MKCQKNLILLITKHCSLQDEWVIHVNVIVDVLLCNIADKPFYGDDKWRQLLSLTTPNQVSIQP